VSSRAIFIPALLIFTSCSRLDTLTPELLDQSQRRWQSHQPASYRMVIDMEGDRIEAGRFEVVVRAGEVVSLRRNGLIVAPGGTQDYSMEGLFRMLKQELGLMEKPALLGAPPGYSVYPMVRFDPENGRLIHYRRTVGGSSSSIELKVVEFEAQL
jgi:hypothetical protein